jgi:hypothetical protein
MQPGPFDGTGYSSLVGRSGGSPDMPVDSNHNLFPIPLHEYVGLGVPTTRSTPNAEKLTKSFRRQPNIKRKQHRRDQ